MARALLRRRHNRLEQEVCSVCTLTARTLPVAHAFCSIDQFMTLSLTAEPRKMGLYEPHFWTRSSSNTVQAYTNANLVPLLFPEHLPCVSFVDRTQLLRGRLESGGPKQLNVEDVRMTRSGEINLGARRRSFGGPDSGPGHDIGDRKSVV